MEHIECQPLEGAMYGFALVNFTKKAIEKAKS
jgi:hypothetical protein